MSVGEKTKWSITARVLLLALLVVLATYVTLYTVAAYEVAKYAFREGGAAYWTARGALGGPTFFPFPIGLRGVGLAVIGRMNPVDEFIYLYLIETGILIVVCILLWTLVAVYFFRLFGYYLK